MSIRVNPGEPLFRLVGCTLGEAEKVLASEQITISSIDKLLPPHKIQNESGRKAGAKSDNESDAKSGDSPDSESVAEPGNASWRVVLVEKNAEKEVRLLICKPLV